MPNYMQITQIIIASSVLYVWIFRFENIMIEFKLFGLSDITRNLIGATKIALSTLLITGIWYPDLITIPSTLMAFLMVAAQYFHFKQKNPFAKRLPSLILLILCIYLILTSTRILY